MPSNWNKNHHNNNNRGGGGGFSRQRKLTDEEHLAEKLRKKEFADRELFRLQEKQWARAFFLQKLGEMPEGFNKEELKRALRGIEAFPKDKVETVASPPKEEATPAVKEETTSVFKEEATPPIKKETTPPIKEAILAIKAEPSVD